MSCPTSIHVGHSYGQKFTMRNLNSVLWCRLAHQSAFHKCLASSRLHKVKWTTAVLTYSIWRMEVHVILSRGQIPCASLDNFCSQKQDSQGQHFSGSHCTLKKREYAISWVKMKYNIRFKVVTGLSVTSSPQGSC